MAWASRLRDSSMKGKRRKKSLSVPRVAEKLLKAAGAKTKKGRANYLIDALFDEALQNPNLDEAAHFLAEMLLGAGEFDERVRRWAKKVARFRR